LALTASPNWKNKYIEALHGKYTFVQQKNLPLNFYVINQSFPFKGKSSSLPHKSFRNIFMLTYQGHFENFVATLISTRMCTFTISNVNSNIKWVNYWFYHSGNLGFCNKVIRMPSWNHLWYIQVSCFVHMWNSKVFLNICVFAKLLLKSSILVFEIWMISKMYVLTERSHFNCFSQNKCIGWK
jgi:hypothetical protein